MVGSFRCSMAVMFNRLIQTHTAIKMHRRAATKKSQSPSCSNFLHDDNNHRLTAAACQAIVVPINSDWSISDVTKELVQSWSEFQFARFHPLKVKNSH